eukprot:c2895_g1_i1 orf=129-287(+)
MHHSQINLCIINHPFLVNTSLCKWALCLAHKQAMTHFFLSDCDEQSLQYLQF